jgi:hypothetical protein
MVGHLENNMKKMGVTSSTKIARDKNAWKLILKEAKVLHGSHSQRRSEKLLMKHESSNMTHKVPKLPEEQSSL